MLNAALLRDNIDCPQNRLSLSSANSRMRSATVAVRREMGPVVTLAARAGR
jgi:hypothetical protein